MITENFSMEELLQLESNAPEEPSQFVKDNLRWGAVNVLQPFRDEIGLPVIIAVGWRGDLRNKRAGSTNFEHPYGMATDIKVPPLSNAEIIEALLRLNVPFYKAIDEQLFDSKGNLRQWVHLSWRVLKSGEKPARLLRMARNTKDNLTPIYA